MAHGASIKAGNLGIGLIGVGKERGSIFAGDHAGEGCIHPLAFQPGAVVFEILTHRAKHQRFVPQQRQGVGNIGSRPPTLPDHRIHQEGQRNAIQPFLEDMIPEIPREGHQIIIRNGTCANNFHTNSRFLNCSRAVTRRGRLNLGLCPAPVAEYA